MVFLSVLVFVLGALLVAVATASSQKVVRDFRLRERLEFCLADEKARLATATSELHELRERWAARDEANLEHAALVRSAKRIISLGPTVSRIKMVSTLDIDLDVFSSGKALESFLDDHEANFAVVPTFNTDPDAMPWTVLVRTSDGWRATEPGIHQFLYDEAGKGMIPADAIVFEKVSRPRRRGRRLMPS